jgi:hypothetical protein
METERGRDKIKSAGIETRRNALQMSGLRTNALPPTSEITTLPDGHERGVSEIVSLFVS